MIVSRSNYLDIITKLKSYPVLAVDTETSGLMPYKGDRLFSIIVSTENDNYYFNFNASPDLSGNLVDVEYVLEDPKLIGTIFSENTNGSPLCVLHNAKFDLHFLAKAGIEISCTVFCTQTMGRIVRNDLLSYSLANLSALVGSHKDDKVLEFIKANKLFDIVKHPGKKKASKNLKYYLVPFDLISAYGLQDGEATFKLYEYEKKRLAEISLDTPPGLPTVNKVAELEQKLTRVLFNMERTGIKVDADYISSSIRHLSAKIDKLKLRFKEDYKKEYVDSAKCFKPLFDDRDLQYGYTATNRASFKEEYLNVVDSPLASLILDIREVEKQLGTYALNFNYMKDYDDVIHCDYKQAGTVTGRMSCANPNLQNVPKDYDLDADFIARRCFIPRDGHYFAMIDFDQMEYRLMLDYAEEMEVIEAVLGGLDVHTATAEVMGVDRVAAKTINFLLLYGGGAGALATSLGISLNEAKGLRALYFEKLPHVKKFISTVISTAEKRGFIFNLMGRRYHLPANLAYKAPNYLIQGGAADIVKRAMIGADHYLAGKDTNLILQVHDELVLEVPNGDLKSPLVIKSIMENAYEYKHLPLTCGIDYSAKSWADKEPFNV